MKLLLTSRQDFAGEFAKGLSWLGKKLRQILSRNLFVRCLPRVVKLKPPVAGVQVCLGGGGFKVSKRASGTCPFALAPISLFQIEKHGCELIRSGWRASTTAHKKVVSNDIRGINLILSCHCGFKYDSLYQMSFRKFLNDSPEDR